MPSAQPDDLQIEDYPKAVTSAEIPSSGRRSTPTGRTMAGMGKIAGRRNEMRRVLAFANRRVLSALVPPGG